MQQPITRSKAMRVANNLHFYTGNHELSTPKHVRCPLESGFASATASMAHIIQQVGDRGTALSIIIPAAYSLYFCVVNVTMLRVNSFLAFGLRSGVASPFDYCTLQAIYFLDHVTSSVPLSVMWWAESARTLWVTVMCCDIFTSPPLRGPQPWAEEDGMRDNGLNRPQR